MVGWVSAVMSAMLTAPIRARLVRGRASTAAYTGTF